MRRATWGPAQQGLRRPVPSCSPALSECPKQTAMDRHRAWSLTHRQVALPCSIGSLGLGERTCRGVEGVRILARTGRRLSLSAWPLRRAGWSLTGSGAGRSEASRGSEPLMSHNGYRTTVSLNCDPLAQAPRRGTCRAFIRFGQHRRTHETSVGRTQGSSRPKRPG